MTAAEHCRKHGWATGDYIQTDAGLWPRRITAIGNGYILVVNKLGRETPQLTIPPTAVRVLNYAGDPLPAAGKDGGT